MKDYEIRIRRNVYDNMGGWNWRVWILPKGNINSGTVDWGWSETREEAFSIASAQMEKLEQTGSK